MMTVANKMFNASGCSTHPCRRPWQILNHAEKSPSSSYHNSGTCTSMILISEAELQNGQVLPMVAYNPQSGVILPDQ